MKALLIYLLKFGLRILYAPMKLFKTKKRIVYLSRQSNEKSLDMSMLEKAIAQQDSQVVQVFRLKMIDDGVGAKIKYCFHLIGDMYYLATSEVAILDTYSIPVSCLKHKKRLTVIQIWHALGALKKFGLQSVGTKEGRDEKVSRAMSMHKNYDFVISPSAATAEFYKEAFGVTNDKIKICPLPRVDFMTDGETRASEFYSLNPGFGGKKLALYVPTFRDREAYVAQMLKTEFEDLEDYKLIISTHPLSKVKKDEAYTPNGDFSSLDLMKIADIIITDYSACAFEASLLMKPLYFFVPDYNEYMKDRGINIDIREEMAGAVFEDAADLVSSIKNDEYNRDMLFDFRQKYVETKNSSNTDILAKFVLMYV